MEISRTKPGPKLLFVSGGSARKRGSRKRKELWATDAALRTAGTMHLSQEANFKAIW